MVYIEEQLKREGMTKTQLAERLGMARNSLVRLLKNPQLDNLERIAEELHCKPSDIILEEKNGSFLCPHCGEEIVWGIDNDK